MSLISKTTILRSEGSVLGNIPVSSGLLRLDLELDQPVGFLPGQFAMLNLTGPLGLVFSRPFSILASDGDVLSFLYRVVGRGTSVMADLTPTAAMNCLGPLGRPFPEPDPDTPTVLIGGGVGLPPVAAWYARYGRARDTAFFGARDCQDVPWDLLDERWRISVDRMTELPAGREAWQGLVTELVDRDPELKAPGKRRVLACGPMPLLRAAARLAAERRWTCYLSLEEHMGCGYGVCKGCVVPVLEPAAGADGVRNATCCQEGPVFRAEDIAWQRPGYPSFEQVD